MLGGIEMPRHGISQQVRRRLPESKTHDRKSSDLPINSVVAPVIVDDPYATVKGEKIEVTRSLRKDPLAAMHNAKQIDEAQYEAGRHWQRNYELLEIGGARAIDPTKEAVDCGTPVDVLRNADRRDKARKELTRIARTLGIADTRIVYEVLACHMTIAQVTQAMGYSSDRHRLYIGKRFKDALDVLATEFGYAMKRRVG